MRQLNERPDTDPPVLINPLKHHAAYIRHFIKNYDHRNLQYLKRDLLLIGDSQMDLYLGELSLNQIATEVVSQLKDIDHFRIDQYELFLMANGGYRKITLHDGSDWILREGEKPEYYIHLHPGRYSRHSVRIKATTLKTVIAGRIVLGEKIQLPGLNQVRTSYLDLAPLKQLDPRSGIGKLLNIF